MTDLEQLLALAVDDNIAWCSAICRAHGSYEIRSSFLWANLQASPPFYPNIITRKPDAQVEVESVVSRVEMHVQAGGWGIKDSFSNLSLSAIGFERVVSGFWYGGTPAVQNIAMDWRTVQDPVQLQQWEHAWGELDVRVFPEKLLSDQRIRFWFRGEADDMRAGVITFDSGSALGISNWFSREGMPLAETGALQAANSVSSGRPVVCWSADDIVEQTGLSKLGPLQVWVSAPSRATD